MRKKPKSLTSPPGDFDETPEWSAEIFDRAEIRIGGAVLRPATGTFSKRGRPKLDQPKKQVTLRLDQDVIDHFRASGRNWQSRINEILRKEIAA